MGSSASASVCYGLPLKEGVEFPWGDDFVGWMLKEILKFKPTKDVYAEGVVSTNEEINQYYEEVREATNKFPAQMETVGHYENSEFILILPGTLQTTEWSAKALEPISLKGTHEAIDKLVAFTEFCARYIPEELRAGKPGYYLFPFYG